MDIINSDDIMNANAVAQPSAALDADYGASDFTAENLEAQRAYGEVSLPGAGIAQDVSLLGEGNATAADVDAFKAKAAPKIPLYEREAWRYGASADFGKLRTASMSEAEHRYLIGEGKKAASAMKRKSLGELLKRGELASSPRHGYFTDGKFDAGIIPQSEAETAFALFARVFPDATDANALRESFGTADRAEIGRTVYKNLSRVAESDYAVRVRWNNVDFGEVQDELRNLGRLAGVAESEQVAPQNLDEAMRTRQYYMNRLGGVNGVVLSMVESPEEFGEAFAFSLMTEDKQRKVFSQILSKNPAKADRILRGAMAYKAYADAGFFASTLQFAKSIFKGGKDGVMDVWNAAKDVFSGRQKDNDDNVFIAVNDAWLNEAGGATMMTPEAIDGLADEEVVKLASKAKVFGKLSFRPYVVKDGKLVPYAYVAARKIKEDAVQLRSMFKRAHARWTEEFSSRKIAELGRLQYHPENWIASTADSLGYSLGYMMPGVLVAAATRNPQFAIAALASYWGASGYGEQMNAWLSQGDVTTEIADRRLSSVLYGGVLAVMGTIGEGAVAAGGRAVVRGVARPIAGTAFGRGAATFMNRGALQFLRHSVNDDTALFLLRYGNGSVAQRAAAYLARSAGSAAVGATIEGGTEVVEEIAMAAARQAVIDERRAKTYVGEDANVDWDAVAESLGEVFKIGGIAGLILGGAFHAPSAFREGRNMLRSREELDGKNIFTATQDRLAVLVAGRQAAAERARVGIPAELSGEGAVKMPNAEVMRKAMSAQGEEGRAEVFASEEYAAMSDEEKRFAEVLIEVYDMTDERGKAQIHSLVADMDAARTGEEYFTTEELRRAGELVGMELRRSDLTRGIRDDEKMLDAMVKERQLREFEAADSDIVDAEARSRREWGMLTDAELAQNIRVGEKVIAENKDALSKLESDIEGFTIFTAGTAARTRAAVMAAQTEYLTGDSEAARERRNVLREMRKAGDSTEFFDMLGDVVGIDWETEEDTPRVRERKAAEAERAAAEEAARKAKEEAEEAERRMAELRAERRRAANEMKRGAQRAGVDIAEDIIRLIQADEDARAEAEYLGTETANRIIEIVRAEERARNAEQLRRDREQYRETAEEEARRRAWEEEQLIPRNEELMRINAQIEAQRAIARTKNLIRDEAERRLHARLETPNAVPVQTDNRGEEILKIVKSGGDAAEEIIAHGWASNRAEAWMLVSMTLIGNSDRIRNAIVKARDSKFTEAILENGWKANEAGLLEDFEDAVVWYAENKERMSELVARMAKGNIFFKAFVNDFASRDYQAMSRFFSYYVYLVRARTYREGLGESRFAHPIVNLTNQMLGVVSYAASRAGVSNDFDADVQYKLMDVNVERSYPTAEEARIILNDALERSKDIIEPYVEEPVPMDVDVSNEVWRELGLAGAMPRDINRGLAEEMDRIGIDAADYASTEASGGSVEAQDAANEAASQGESAESVAEGVASEAASVEAQDAANEAALQGVSAEDAANEAAKTERRRTPRAKSKAAAEEVAGIAVRDNADGQIGEVARMEKKYAQKKRTTRLPFVPAVIVDGVTANTIRADMPYRITGNKADIIKRHSAVFASLGKLAQAQGGRVIDAFFGAGAYTHFLGSQGALPKNSVINEWDASRYITNKQMRDDAAGVKRALEDILRRWESSPECAAFKKNIDVYNERVKNRKRGEVVNFLNDYSKDTVVKWINDELTGKHGVSYDAGGKLRDAAHTAAMYLFLQNRTARGRVISLRYDADTKRVEAPAGDKKTLEAGDVSQGFVRIDNDTKLGRYSSPLMGLDASGKLDAKSAAVIDRAEATLSGKEIHNGDGWKAALPEELGGMARKGDVVFVDPPYWYTMGYSEGNKGAAHNDAQKQLDAIRRMVEEGNKRDITYVFTNEYGFYGYGSSGAGADVNLDDEIVPALEAIPGARVNKAVRRGTGGVNMDVVLISGNGRFLLAPSRKELDAQREKSAGKAYAKINAGMEAGLPDAVKPLARDWNRAATKNVLFQKATEVFTGTRDARLQDKLRRFGAWLERAGVTVDVMSDEDFENRVRELSSDIRYSLGGGTSTIRAWHGSPHEFAAEEGAPFGRFGLSFVGTGEGGQAFGYGIYISEVEGVAEGYAKRLGDNAKSADAVKISKEYGSNVDRFFEKYDLHSRGTRLDRFKPFMLFNGVTTSRKLSQAIAIEKKRYRENAEVISELDKISPSKEMLDEYYIALFSDAMPLGENTGLSDDKFEDYKKRLLYEYEASESKPEYYTEEQIKEIEQRIEEADALYAKAEKLAKSKFATKKKYHHLYSVELSIASDESNLLDWIDKPSEEQLERIRRGLEARGLGEDAIQRILDESDFEGVYHRLDRSLGGDEAASLFLKGLGFVGHKYPVGSFGNGRRDYDDGTNYVIYDTGATEITGAVRWIRDDSGVVYGYYNRETKEIGIREGARADTLVHELGWHATYDWASANAPELYEQMRRYAQSAPDEIKEAVASAYGYAEGVIDEETFLDEAGAAFFSKEHSQAVEDAIGAIGDSSLRGRARRWWNAFRELLFKMWTKLRGTYSRYYTEDGKRKADLKGILAAANTAQEAVAGIADAFAKAQLLADYADAYKRQNPQETTRGDVLGWAGRNRGNPIADAALSGVRMQRGFTDAAKVIEDNRADAERAATRVLASNRQHRQWADILLGGWQDFVESGTSKGGLIEARRFDALQAKIMVERRKANAERDAALEAQARVEFQAGRAPSREAAGIVLNYQLPMFDGTEGWAQKIYDAISEREPDKEHARKLASVVWAEQFSRVANKILSPAQSVDVHGIIERILSGKGSTEMQLRRARKIESILIHKNEAQLLDSLRKSVRHILESHKGQFKPQKKAEDRAYYGATEMFLRDVARYGLARTGKHWEEYFEKAAAKSRGELLSESEPVRLEAMARLRALDLWWGKSYAEMDAAELIAVERFIRETEDSGRDIAAAAAAAKKTAAEKAWRDIAAAAGESATIKGGDPNRDARVRNFLAFGQSVRSKLESAVRFASEEKYSAAVDAVRELDLRITEANNAAAGMLTEAEHAFLAATLKLGGQEDKITPKTSGASYVRMSRSAEKILFDLILTRPEGSERFSLRGDKLTWAELIAQYLMMSQVEWADMYSDVDLSTARDPSWREKNPAYERFVKLGELEAFLGEKRVAFAKEASRILQSFDARIDAQSVKDTGVSLSYKRGQGYFPIVHSMKDYMANLTPSVAGGTPSIVPKILIPRQHSRLDIDEHADVFSLFRRQAYDIAHYIAHGEAGTSNDIRQLLGSEEYAALREDIAKVGGADAANALWIHLNQVLAGRLEGAEFYSHLDGGINQAFAAMRWLTRAAGLGFNIVSGLKSALGGIPSYINHYGFGATLAAMARAIPRGNAVFTDDFKELLDSEGYKQRYGNNALNRALAAARMPKVIPPKLAMRLMRTDTNMMAFTSYGDRIPLFLVGSSIYSAMKNHYIAEGKTIEEAKRLAQRDFWQVQDATQQARQIQNMDALTRSGSAVLKVFAQFLTSPMQFISDQIHAAETLAARKDKDSFKRLQTIMIHNHILQPGAMFLATIIAGAVLGSARDEEDGLFTDEDLVSFLLGAMTAIPVIGSAIEWAVMSAVADGNPYYSANLFAPSASETASKLAQKTTKLLGTVTDGEEDTTKEAAVKLAESFAAVRYFNRAYDKWTGEEDEE